MDRWPQPVAVRSARRSLGCGDRHARELSIARDQLVGIVMFRPAVRIAAGPRSMTERAATSPRRNGSSPARCPGSRRRRPAASARRRAASSARRRRRRRAPPRPARAGQRVVDRHHMRPRGAVGGGAGADPVRFEPRRAAGDAGGRRHHWRRCTPRRQRCCRFASGASMVSVISAGGKANPPAPRGLHGRARSAGCRSPGGPAAPRSGRRILLSGSAAAACRRYAAAVSSGLHGLRGREGAAFHRIGPEFMQHQREGQRRLRARGHVIAVDANRLA